MTKQEEIREGLAVILYQLVNPDDDDATIGWEEYGFRRRYYLTADLILAYFTDKGVVIKLPKSEMRVDGREIVAVESLIEEKVKV